nr:ferredoxin [Methylobacterium phyllostachyos]
MSPPAPQPGFRVSVDLNVGQGYAQCCHAAPQHFRIEGREALFSDRAPAAWDRAKIERAWIACPVPVIRVEGNGQEGA